MNIKKLGISLDAITLALAVVAIAVSASPALAQESGAIFTKSCTMLMRIKTFLFAAVYVLGAIGLVIIAVSAFLGRFKFAHLISLGGGLFIVAMADLLIGWLVSEGSDGATTTGDGCSYSS